MSGPASRRHTGEPATSDKTRLATWLTEEGTRLGFHAETDYTSPEGDTADAVWHLNEGGKPIITFTVEQDPMTVMASALQWAGSSTEPKSWRHICVLTSEAPEFPLPLNIKLLDARNQAELGPSLEELASEMTRLLRSFTDDEPGDTLPEAVKRLSKLTASWPKEMWSPRLKLKTKTTFDECLSLFAAENEEDEEADAPLLQPSRKIVPLDLVGGGATFEGVLMRLTEAKDGRLLFSTEHRNYPFIFRLAAPVGGGESKLDLWFDADKANIPQALRYRELAEGVTSSRAAVFSCPSGELAKIALT